MRGGRRLDIVGRMLGLMLAVTLAAAQPPNQPGPGVSEALAHDRAASLTDIAYDLTFDIPESPAQPVHGRARIRFRLRAPRAVVLDFAQPAERVRNVRIGGRAANFSQRDGHLVLAAAETVAGVNDVTIDFDAGDEPLNRNPDFLYTLFVPARARLAFPCFDQPDLKSTFALTLEVPDGWQAVANGAEVGRGPAGAGRSRIQFAETAPLPTYLFAFVAGRFSVETAVRAGRTLRVFHRETDRAKVERNLAAVFDLHATALDWLERYTSIPYAFGKFDVVLIPSFQFGGMEHAGAILYNASRILLDESATQNQMLERASLIAHETSHMWFGDLVTMRWFNDVWTKEVFANFMAAKIVNPSFPQVNHELRFLLAHYPAAYQVDRTAGTNPIRQSLANLDEAGQLYGPIIYEKAPIVMRQLETIVGENAFRDGLREYLTRYKFGNAAWPDLVRLLDARTPRDLAAWSRAWVDERGRPEFRTSLRLDRAGRIASLTLTASDPLKRNLVWPQRLRVALGYPAGNRVLDVDVAGGSTVVRAAAGLPRPSYVLPNGEGLGYGLFRLDDDSRRYLLGHVEELPDALTRGSAWVTLWDNMLDGRIAPGDFLEAALRAVPREADEQNAERVLAYVTRAFWRFLPDSDRAAFGPRLEATLRAGIDRVRTTSEKSTWFNAFRDTAISPASVEWLARVWRREERVPGLPLAEPDEITLALELAVREAPGWQEILRRQYERTQNPDRKARFAFVMPALSADPVERGRAFDRLRLVENRRREPWVLESLQYLNHPLRAADAERFVQPALDLLIEIRRTGDIFFPARWMDATLSGHRSPRAAATVRAFLDAHPEYPLRLRWTILSAADELFRVTRASPRE
jgi:aminopeptidase N